ncbi:hypothetical protein LJC42_08510 [Eubacteriales bacterium OttesenSCG-928-K08]|nr:hypothetical protein [Eubacteriales bacterium OttesenSCG-928-K08]
MREITNTQCGLYHTAYCDMLNMKSCGECFVNGMQDYNAVLQDLDVLSSLLPPQPMHTLFTGPDCQFCKREHPKQKAYFGLVDLGHAEPKRTTRNVIGLKVKTQVGSILPVQIGTCKDCRRNMLLLEYLPILIPILSGIVTLLLMMIPAIADSLERIAQIMPFAVFVGVVAISFIVSAMLKKRLRVKYEKETILDVFSIPLITQLRARGWFPLTRNGNVPRVVFSRKRMQHGVCTGTPEDATADRFIKREVPPATMQYQPMNAQPGQRMDDPGAPYGGGQ